MSRKPAAPPEDQARKKAAPCAMVIFGASGDLTSRMLMPALDHLTGERALPDGFFVVGVSRTPMTDVQFRATMADAVARAYAESEGHKISKELLENLYYVAGNFDDPATFRNLARILSKHRASRGGGGENHIFYLATPPDVDPLIVRKLGEAGLASEKSGVFARVVVEKPFGRDLESACQLNADILEIFHEHQIYRIDHYLGKETVQNIMALRFANGVFEPLWERQYVDNIQIAVAESLGVGHRAGYYEKAGVIRDMFQNHLLQLLTLMAMEEPARFDADSVRGEKVKVLRSIRPFEPSRIDEWAVRGQYGAGVVEGEKVPAYRDEPDVSKKSSTPTYAAVKFLIDNWRWAGVPFYLRSGKRLARRTTEVAIEFREVPHMFFKDARTEKSESNVLRLKIQPDEGISLKFLAKIPGAGMKLTPVMMDFPYSQLGAEEHGAYERLLLDVMHGDATLFTRGDEVEEAWRVVAPILDAWENRKTSALPSYPAGTWGPEEADRFMEREGRRWRKL
jgi:glucose-6-phosphate 1-dehydrogenase